MKVVSDKNDLDYGNDVKLLTVGQSVDLKEYFLANKNRTEYAVMFCAE